MWGEQSAAALGQTNHPTRTGGLDTAVLVQTSHPTRTDGLDAAALAKLGLVQVATRTLKLTAKAA